MEQQPRDILESIASEVAAAPTNCRTQRVVIKGQ